MVLPYYRRLTRRQQATYRASDALPLPSLGDLERLRELADGVGTALDSGDARTVGTSVRRLIAALVDDLGAPPLRVRVRSRRPSSAEEELHGLYEPEWSDGAGSHPATITVWMRTVAHGNVVRHRTFLRTVLHELVHHLDYELHALDESFHTEGFFRRESALMRQLCPKPAESTELADGDARGERGVDALGGQLSFGF